MTSTKTDYDSKPSLPRSLPGSSAHFLRPDDLDPEPIPAPSYVWTSQWLLAVIGAIALLIAGQILHWRLLGLAGSIGLLVLCLPVIFPQLKRAFLSSVFGQRFDIVLASILCLVASFALLEFTGAWQAINSWSLAVNWEAFAAIGQILIALVALWVAWQQVRTSVLLTSQQNTITQQQTIDAYFQGISDLVLNPEGQLEDWPLERAIAAGRTAAIINGSDAGGKAKVLQFLSVSNLLSPLKRDNHLGRPILDGAGGYLRDRHRGIRVVYLGAMLVAEELSDTDLRGIDFSEINLSGASLDKCNLSYTNFVMANLTGTSFRGANLRDALFFVGAVNTASPYAVKAKRNFRTGTHTGAIVIDADFTEVINLSEEQRQYLCTWGGEKTRATIPGGCDDIPNRTQTDAIDVESNGNSTYFESDIP
ncbi:MAG: pentapeptide repeat-containing protein [Cyanobacteria bacterium P01_F01_bin.33]